MNEKIEKIASISTVQFLFKSNRHKLRSVRFELNFYCHNNVFVTTNRNSVVMVQFRRNSSRFCCDSL